MGDRTAALLRDIDATCRKLADPARVTKYSRYFSEGYDPYGVDHEDPRWIEARDRWLAANGDLGLSGFIALGERLFATGKYEHGAVALWFVSQFREDIGPRAFAGVGRWFDGGVRNWAHADVICGELLSPRLASGAVGLRALGSWRTSPHKFKRRAVPVSMLGLLKTTGDYRPLLELIAPLMEDGERVVQQGLGWFLREAWKRQPAPVEAFLDRWKDRAPRLVFQYATEKMGAADRARFRRTSPAPRTAARRARR
jgi:3-methyladenine DNA glycosylase AlkD